MLRRIHLAAGAIAFLMILSFWTSTVVSELSGDLAAIAAVKAGIMWGMIVLIPALMVTGGSGFRLAGDKRLGLLGVKKRRMPFIAANGVLILVPSAFFLCLRAEAGVFDMAFYTVQAIELLAGGVNLTLMALNMRDGFRLTRRFANA
ncbi:MAG: hypothetical protein MI753_10915 [Hyphomicrobiales bacterium]|nr:hypothetical protein [Hyphomicrobiales bacterium]